MAFEKAQRFFQAYKDREWNLRTSITDEVVAPYNALSTDDKVKFWENICVSTAPSERDEPDSH